jgi:excisionase family DNA binding protein
MTAQTTQVPLRPVKPEKWPNLIDAAKAAEILNVSRSTLQRLIGDEIPGYKIGGKWHVDADDLHAFLAAARHPSRTGWSAKPAGQRGVA